MLSLPDQPIRNTPHVSNTTKPIPSVKCYDLKEDNYPLHNMLAQQPRIPLPPLLRLRPQIHQIPTLAIPLPHHLLLRPRQQRQELVKEPASSLRAELVVQPPQPAAQMREPIVHVFARRHPECHGGVVGADGGDEALDAVRVGDVFEGAEVQRESGGFAPVRAVWRVDWIADDVVGGEGESQAESCRFVVARGNDADGGGGGCGGGDVGGGGAAAF